MLFKTHRNSFRCYKIVRGYATAPSSCTSLFPDTPEIRHCIFTPLKLCKFRNDANRRLQSHRHCAIFLLGKIAAISRSGQLQASHFNLPISCLFHTRKMRFVRARTTAEAEVLKHYLAQPSNFGSLLFLPVSHLKSIVPVFCSAPTGRLLLMGSFLQICCPYGARSSHSHVNS